MSLLCPCCSPSSWGSLSLPTASPPQEKEPQPCCGGAEMLGAAAVALSEGLPSAGGGCFLPPALIMRCNLSGGRDTACFDGG